jgi:hypothetical protein
MAFSSEVDAGSREERVKTKKQSLGSGSSEPKKLLSAHGDCSQPR